MDEYNESDTTLAKLAGTTMTAFPRRVLREVPQVPGPSPLPHAANGHIIVGQSKVPFVALGDSNRFLKLAPNSKPLAVFDADCDDARGGDGCGGDDTDPTNVAAVATQVGGQGGDGTTGGNIVQLAWQPGLSYLPNATQEFYIPNAATQFPGAIRDFLHSLLDVRPISSGDGVAASGASGASSARPSLTVAAAVKTPEGVPAVGVETVLLASGVGAVVTMINWGGNVNINGNVTLSVDLGAAGFDHTGQNLVKVIDATTGESLTPVVTPGSGVVTVVTKAYYANFIVLHRK